MTLSPLTRRRLAIFRAHTRGFWSFRIFAVLFVLSLFASVTVQKNVRDMEPAPGMPREVPREAEVAGPQ